MSSIDYKDEHLDLEIAIIGMAGRFPGAENIDQLWQNVCEGVESVRDFTDEELEQLGVPEEQRQNPAYVPRKVDFEGADLFDASFFGYSPREATNLDPQQRLFLETVWHGIENAGYAGRLQEQLVGTYAGCGANTYLSQNLMSGQADQNEDIADLLGLMNGNDKDSLSARVAYQFNLRGPAITVQTACSTSLVAVHQACRGLLNHEADIALAGGVWLNLLQKGGYLHQEGAILSADGKCRPFDENASGTLIGSGAGVVVLKRLREALEDGDNIHAIIKGSAVNNDGSDKVGFSAPSITGQTDVILAAQAMAEIGADSIDYVEAHGTGTVLGDPIEVSALTQAFRQSTDKSDYCAIGSIKSNIGHLDAAAGVTGLIKAVQALKHKTLPASLNYQQANPQINFENSPFYVNTRTRAWDKAGTPRRAAVSSFGMGGTNAHVILQEAAQPTQDTTTSQAQALLLSARSQASLEQSIQKLAEHVRDLPVTELNNVAHTLAYGRELFRHRAVVLLDQDKSAADLLNELDPLSCIQGEVSMEDPGLAFLFPGQGSQHSQMAADLYQSEPGFRALVDECCDKLKPYLDTDLRTVIWPAATHEQQSAELLQQTQYTQPALFVIEYAMASWWIKQGITPRALLGHSIGEYVAACISGVFSLDDALKLVAKRGQLLQNSPEGAMLSVTASEEDIEFLLQDGCDLAAVNGESNCVLAGTVAAIEKAAQQLTAKGYSSNQLHVTRAFHSSLLDPQLDEFRQVLATVNMQAPRLPFVSNVTGSWITAEQAQSADYWCQHVRNTVRFSQGLDTLSMGFAQVYLEVGPGETLTTLAKRHPSCEQRVVLSSQVHPQRLSQNQLQPRRCLAKLWSLGYELDKQQLLHCSEGNIVELPGYAFEHRSYWVNPKLHKQSQELTQEQEEFLPLDKWFNLPGWRRIDDLPAVTLFEAGQSLLLFSSPSALCQSLVQQAEQKGLKLIHAEPDNTAAELKQLADDHYSLNISDKQQLLALFQQLQQLGIEVTQVGHFATLGLSTDFEQVQQAGFFNLMALAQVMSEANLQQVSLMVVTDQLVQVTGDEQINPAKATLLAPCRVIPQEYAGIKTCLVDVNSKTGSEGVLASRLLAEIQQMQQPCTRVAYRGNFRFEPDYIQVQRQPDLQQSKLKTNGVYLITGGLGGIGLSLAKHLAANWQAKLILTSRTELPAAELWSQLAKDPEQEEKLKLQLEQLLELQELGAEVLLLAADVSQPQQLDLALNQARDKFGRIDGLIHAAGIAGGGLIAHKVPEDSYAVWQAKIQGTQHLVASLQQDEPDFMLFCSSTTAIVGGMGSLDYCAANAYLDAYALSLSTQGKSRVLSVNWDSWREVGMAAFLDLPEGYGIQPQQGALVLERLLQGPDSANVITSTVAFKRQLELQNQPKLPEHLPASDGESGTVTRHPRPALTTAYVEAEDELQQQLAEAVSEFIGVEPVGIHDNLFELGGDSLMAIQLLSRVQKQFGVELQPAEFFKQPTVEELAATIEWLMIEQIESSDV